MATELRREPVHPCIAANSAIECDLEGTWFVVTRTWTCFVCERHRRLVEIKLEREGLEPRMVELSRSTSPAPA